MNGRWPVDHGSLIFRKAAGAPLRDNA
jgi:hypothetical protein